MGRTRPKTVWVRVSPKNHAGLRKLAADGFINSDDKETSRWYASKGKRWPLLCIAIYDHYLGEPGYKISISIKPSLEGRMTDTPLPKGLLPALIEMLEEPSRKNEAML